MIQAQDVENQHVRKRVPRGKHFRKTCVQHLSSHDSVQVQYCRWRRAQLLAEDAESSTPSSCAIFGEPHRHVWLIYRTRGLEIQEKTGVARAVHMINACSKLLPFPAQQKQKLSIHIWKCIYDNDCGACTSIDDTTHNSKHIVTAHRTYCTLSPVTMTP